MCQCDHITYQCGQYRQLCFIAIVSRINVISIASNYAISIICVNAVNIMSVQSLSCQCSQYHVKSLSCQCSQYHVSAVTIMSMQSELCQCNQYRVNPISIVCANAVSIMLMQSVSYVPMQSVSRQCNQNCVGIICISISIMYHSSHYHMCHVSQ